MGGHEAVSQNVHMLVQILFDVFQEVEIVLPLEEDRLAVITAVVEVIILIGEESCFAAGHDRAPGTPGLPKFGIMQGMERG